MTLWMWLLLSCLLAYAWKLLGYLVPAGVLRDPRMSRIAGTMTIGLLASLTIVNTVASGQTLALDARLGALAAAGIALVFRAPFLVPRRRRRGSRAPAAWLGLAARHLLPYRSVTVFSPYLPPNPRGSIRI
jgi:hypothetical protein